MPFWLLIDSVCAYCNIQFHHNLITLRIIFQVHILTHLHVCQVVEVNMRVEKAGDGNVHNNAFYAEETLLKNESEAARDCNPLTARHWIVRHLWVLYI